MTRTVLMIHGVGCAGNAWDRVRGLMEARGFVCEAPTLFPEFRVAQNPTGQLATLTLHDYVEQAATWARDILKRTGEQPIIMGHSMGGLIAQKLAERGMAGAAILVTPAQPVDCQVQSLKPLWTFANILFGGGPEKSYKVWKRGFKWGVLNRVDPARHDEIYAQALFDSGMVYRDLGQPAKDPHRTASIDENRIGCPILTIGAEEDRATVIEAVRKVAQKYARIGGDYREYAQAAHWIVDEPVTGKMVDDICTWIDRRQPAD
jgi:alpha-beta hydrolase superfamily lysophospholipase